jgi:sugar porter (SP) family MFS transporter
MRSRVLLWSVVSALAGFLFGFDTVVISGAEMTIQALWQLSPERHGLATGAALWGTLAGSLLGGWPADRFGRKRTLLGVGVLFLVGSIWSAVAADVWSFIVARFLGGVGIGVSTVAAPLYISEIAPPAWRGRLTGLFQFNIVFGILVAFLSNYVLGSVGGADAWRWMLGVMAAPSLVYTLACLYIPESPRWLLARKRDRAGGLAVLRLIDPEADAVDLAARADRIAAAAAEHGGAGFWTARLRTPILLAFLIAFFNQMSGINAVLYFAPRIFEMTGLGSTEALSNSVWIGVTNLAATFVGLWLIDRLGRRSLLYIGSVGYIASLGLCAWAFHTGTYAVVPWCIFAFIAAHAVGQGAVIWVYIAEVFPDRYRASGQALGSSTHWGFAALLATVFPKMVDAFAPAAVFAFFAGMMVLQLVWVNVMVVETKGVPLEEVQRRLGVE